MNKKKRYTVMALSALLVASTMAHNDEAKPWTFWYWMYGAVSKAGIHADLVGMKNVGLGGTYLMPIRGVSERPEYQGEAAQLSSKFWEMVDYSFQQADSLGLDMGIHICDGFALAGNPSILPAESMQKVVWTDTIVGGGKKIEGMQMWQPESYKDGKLQPAGSEGGYYQDIAAFAIRCKEKPQLFKPEKIEYTEAVSTAKGYYLAAKPASIIYSFHKPVTVRSMRVVPNGNNIQSQRLLVQASDDGINFRDIKQLVPPRQGWQNTMCDYTFSLPTTTARYFRFSWTPEGTEPGAEDLDAAKWKPLLKLENIILSNQPMINQYEGKTGAVWRIETDAAAKSETVAMADVLPLKLENGMVMGVMVNGNLMNKLPKGTWRLLRMGHTSTGQTNATAGTGKGLEVDKFSPAAVRKLFNSWYALFLNRPHSDVVKYLHIDSWECGSQNWGYQFAEEFKARRGYDLIPYLPIMAGVPMESASRYEQVLKDIRLTINDLVNEKFFKTFTDLAHEQDIEVNPLLAAVEADNSGIALELNTLVDSEIRQSLLTISIGKRKQSQTLAHLLLLTWMDAILQTGIKQYSHTAVADALLCLHLLFTKQGTVVFPFYQTIIVGCNLTIIERKNPLLPFLAPTVYQGLHLVGISSIAIAVILTLIPDNTLHGVTDERMEHTIIES
jgi:hypothetical protein